MNGRCKRLSALLLLCVYLLTVAVPVAHALSCPCLHAGHFHPLQSYCLAAEACSGAAHTHLDSRGCCGCNHSAGVELYTPGRGEDRESIRWMAPLSAVAPTVDALPEEPGRIAGERAADRPEHCGCNVCLNRFALRAPPVSA